MKTFNLIIHDKSSEKRSYVHKSYWLMLFLILVCFTNGKSQIPISLDETGNIGDPISPLIPGSVPTGITQICGFGADTDVWLQWVEVVSGVQLSIKPGMDVPNPIMSTSTPCPDCSSCTTSAGVYDANPYLAADYKGCYRINILFGGSNPIEQTLCIYGDAPLEIIADESFDFDAHLGEPHNMGFRVNRDDSPELYDWEVTGPSDLTRYLNPLSDEGLGATSIFDLTWEPDGEDEITGMCTLTVTNSNDPSETASEQISVNASKQEEDHKPKDLVFVVDVSGSMGLTAECFTEDKISKLELIKYRYREAKDVIAGMFGPNDRYGLVTFESTATKISGNSLINGSSFQADFDTWIRDMEASGSTTMGDGIKKAIEILGPFDTNRDKYIILLTNGMQNTSPMVEYKNGVVYIDDDPDITLDERYKIIPIAVFQPNPDFLGLLQKIADATSGVRVVDICDVRLDEALNAVQSSNSPKTVVFRESTLSGTTATEAFAIDEKFDKIIISVATIGNNNITFDVEKNIGGNWQEFSAQPDFQPSGNSSHRVFSKVISSGITPEGEYRVLINSSIPNIGYRLTVIIDDRGIKHYTYSGIGRYRAGHKLSLGTRLRFINNPVPPNQVSSVKAFIQKPDASLINQFSKKKVPSRYLEKIKDPESKPGHNTIKRRRLLPPDGQSFEPGLPIIDQKFQILTYETNFMDELSWTEYEVNLQNKNDGIYRANFNDTRLTGIYNIRFEIEGNHDQMGAFKRTEYQSVPVLFATPDLEDSKLYVLQESPMYLTFTPVDEYANMLGPGKADVIDVKMTTGSRGAIIDYFDGKYVIPLYVPDTENPIITIRIYDRILYKGPLTQIPRKKSTISISGGIAVPLSTFSNNYSQGFNFELKYNYNFTRSVALNLEGGYYSFADSTSNAYKIIGGAIGAQYLKSFGTSAWYFYIDGNLGYYKPDNIDGGFGINVGFSIVRYFNHWLSGAIDASYYKVFTSPDQIDFMTTSLALRFHF